MTTTWADIQRLASDLQQIQLAESGKKLSEVNCIEIVTSLIAAGAINLVVSTDAKEYVTFDHLQTEIRNECAASGNRVALTDLATRLRVKLSHVENAAAAVVRDHFYILCNGELLNRLFIDEVCAKINAKLHETGEISLLQLTRIWNVPAEFITNFILPEMGRRVQAVRFEEHFYTIAFIANLKRQLVAILTALTKTTSLAAIHTQLNVSQSLFFTVWTELTDAGVVANVGQLVGMKNSLKSVFVPNVHVRLAKQFVRHTLADSGYIDCSILKKLSIADQAALFKELFPDAAAYSHLKFLPNFIVTGELWEEIEHSFIENMKLRRFCIIEDCLPTALSSARDSDLEKIAALLVKSPRAIGGASWNVTADHTVVYEEASIVDNLIGQLAEFVEEKAKAEAPNILAALRVANHPAGLKSGGAGRKGTATDDDWGTGGGKSGKKKSANKKGGSSSAKSKSNKHEADPNDNVSPTTLNADELNEKLHELVGASKTPIPELLLNELRDELLDRANILYRAAVEKCFNCAELAASDQKRRTHEALLHQARSVYTSICAFENGASALGESLGSELKSHLLKTLGAELAAVLLTLLSSCDLTLADAQKAVLSTKIRNELVAAVPETKCQEALHKIFNSANTATAVDFHEAIDSLCDFSVLLRQPDKTAKQEFLSNYYATLRQRIVDVTPTAANVVDEAPVLLLSFILYSFGRHHRLCVHASGKFVTNLSAHLVANNKRGGDGGKEIIPNAMLETVLDTQRRVVALLRQRHGADSDDADGEAAAKSLSAVCENLSKLKAFLLSDKAEE